MLMTYSKNTEKVRLCKRKLVQAFESAKIIAEEKINSRVNVLESSFASAFHAIAQLQESVVQLQAQSKNPGEYIPPGWDKEVWKELEPQDKCHFRFLYRRRGFRPSPNTEQPLLLSESLKQQQKEEMWRLIGEVSQEEKQRIEKTRKVILEQFWNDKSNF